MKKIKELFAKLVQKIKDFFKKRVVEDVIISDPYVPPVVITPMPTPTPDPVPAPQDDIFTRNPGLRGWLGSDFTPPRDYGPPAGQTIDRRTIRNLSGDQGNMGIAEGGAYSTHTFTVLEAPGSIVEITTGQTQSELGVCDQVTLAGPDSQVADGLFNAQAKIKFVASGAVQEVHVILHKAGAVAVQRN